MSQPTAIAPDLSSDAYLVVGLATCYVKVDGEIIELTLCEPVPSAYLDALFMGVPTSYRCLYGITLGEVVVNGIAQVPQIISAEPNSAAVQMAQDFVTRAMASARTYQSNPQTQAQIPAGTKFQEVQYSTEKKRMLNEKHIVNQEDNVKQHQYTHMTL
jgi:hypothetical protein